MLVARYTPANLPGVVQKLKALLLSPEEIRKIPKILGEAGIRFLVVEALPASKIDGVCFWLNEDAPVVGLSLRFDRIDNFWFVLRHEIEHVARRHGLASEMLDIDVENDSAVVADEERFANLSREASGQAMD